MGDPICVVEVPLRTPSGKKLVLFACLAGCVLIAGAWTATALTNHKQAGAAASAVVKAPKYTRSVRSVIRSTFFAEQFLSNEKHSYF